MDKKLNNDDMNESPETKAGRITLAIFTVILADILVLFIFKIGINFLYDTKLTFVEMLKIPQMFWTLIIMVPVSLGIIYILSSTPENEGN